MKKFKSLLLLIMAAIMAFTIPVAAACNTDENNTETLNSISLNLDNVKVKFVGDEEFTSAGLVVYASITNTKGENENRDVTSDAVVDSSAFNKNETGNYDIKVSYTFGDVTKETSYTVTYMSEDREGLYVTHSDGTRAKTIDLTAANRTASIDPSDIVVKYVLYNEVQNEITDYSVHVYRDAEEITTFTGLGSGTYQIWVSKESSKVPGYMLEDFVFVYVVEDVSDLRFVGGTTTQNIGIDTITSTWTYTVTSSIGETINLDADDVEVTIAPLTAGNKNATVSYTYYNAKGVEKKLTVVVPYSIVKGESQEIATNSYAYSALPSNVTGSSESTVALSASDFTGVNSFLTVMQSATVLNARPSTDNGIIEIRGDVFQIEFKGVGTLEITARSTSNTNLSSIGVKNEAGEFMSGMVTSPNATLLTYTEGEMYQVTGKAAEAATITFIIPAKGTYTIFTNDLDPDGNSAYARNTRVMGIVKTDVYDTTQTSSYSVFSSVGDVREIDLNKEEV